MTCERSSDSNPGPMPQQSGALKMFRKEYIFFFPFDLVTGIVTKKKKTVLQRELTCVDSPFKTCHTVQLPADYIFNCVSGHCVAVFQETASQHEVVPPAPAPRLPGNLRNSGNGVVARKLTAF